MPILKLYEIPYGSQFRLVASLEDRVYTLDRGDGMWFWVSWLDEGTPRTGQMYMGERVTMVESNDAV